MDKSLFSARALEDESMHNKMQYFNLYDLLYKLLCHTCPKIKNQVLHHLGFPQHHKYFLDQDIGNVTECFFPLLHLNTTHLEDNIQD